MGTMFGVSALFAALSAGNASLPSPNPQAAGFPYAAKDYAANLLMNGGAESWSNGIGASIPLDFWYPNGDPANTFANTTFLGITRVPGSADCTRGLSGGEWAVQLIANVPGSYLSQRITGFGELRCKTVTLTAIFETPFVVASPTITIDDGISSSSDTHVLVVGVPRMLSVVHKVSENATKLEIRIDPGSSVVVDDIQLVLGAQPNAPYSPRGNAEQGLNEVPKGIVFDWFRVHASVPIPEGFALCDGSAVTDVDSPYVGQLTPDLRDRFVLGASSPAAIGTMGGVPSHNLAHNHTHSHTHSGTTEDQNSGCTGFNFWLDGGGAGTPSLPCHEHDFTTGQASNVNTSSALGTIDNRPPYVGLLKIMRVK